jgi:HSP20 family molecular chaperone IbpA
MAVRKRQSSGRTMRDSNTVNIAGVAKKPLIVTVHRNQLIIRSLRSLPKEKRRTKSILN